MFRVFCCKVVILFSGCPEERLLEDAKDFAIDDVITVVESMARFQVAEASVLQACCRGTTFVGGLNRK